MINSELTPRERATRCMALILGRVQNMMMADDVANGDWEAVAANARDIRAYADVLESTAKEALNAARRG